MRRSRRLVVALAVSSLVTAGGITAGLSLVANANLAGTCIASQAAQATCMIGDTQIGSPTAITITVKLQGDASTSNPADSIKVTWAGTCSVNGTNTAISSPTTPTPTPLNVGTAVDINVPFPSGMTASDSCDITSTTGTLTGTGNFIMTLNWTASASPSATTSAPPPPPPSVHVSTIKGYANKCMDDRGNSSANRNAVIIWSCNTHDSAQGWKYTSSELKHSGKCLNDQGNGGSGTHVVLWSCNGGSNERWFHTGSGEFILSLSSHGLLCLTDPGNSTTNGTRLVVSKCRNTSNQHWT